MIVVRIIGLFVLIDVFKLLPTTIPQLSTMTMYDDTSMGIVALVTFFVVFVILLFLIVYFLLMKPGKLVEKLELDTGFEEEKFELNLSKSTILRISIIVIGGIVLLYEIPHFVHEIFFFWQAKQIRWIEDPETRYLIYSSVIIVISYFLIYYNKKIVEYIEKKTIDVIKPEDSEDKNKEKTGQ
jgi:hypothetical protein